MKAYEESYYIVYPNEEYDNCIVPTPYTASTHWKFEKLTLGSKALSFVSENEDLDFLMENYALAFSVPNFVVTKKLKELLELGLYGCQFFPAIIKNEEKSLVEGMWALNTFQELDCIDFKRSQFYMPDDGSTDIDGFTINADMDTYRFRKEVLDKIPEEERLVFQIARTSIGEIFVHQKVVDIFTKQDVKGISFFKVSEFEDGDQY